MHRVVLILMVLCAVAAASEGGPLLRKGSTDHDGIKRLQTLLNECGFPCTVNGSFDETLATVVREFKTSSGDLPAGTATNTEVVNAAVWKSLEACQTDATNAHAASSASFDGSLSVGTDSDDGADDESEVDRAANASSNPDTIPGTPSDPINENQNVFSHVPAQARAKARLAVGNMMKRDKTKCAMCRCAVSTADQFMRQEVGDWAGGEEDELKHAANNVLTSLCRDYRFGGDPYNHMCDVVASAHLTKVRDALSKTDPEERKSPWKICEDLGECKAWSEGKIKGEADASAKKVLALAKKLGKTVNAPEVTVSLLQMASHATHRVRGAAAAAAATTTTTSADTPAVANLLQLGTGSRDARENVGVRVVPRDWGVSVVAPGHSLFQNGATLKDSGVKLVRDWAAILKAAKHDVTVFGNADVTADDAEALERAETVESELRGGGVERDHVRSVNRRAARPLGPEGSTDVNNYVDVYADVYEPPTLKHVLKKPVKELSEEAKATNKEWVPVIQYMATLLDPFKCGGCRCLVELVYEEERTRLGSTSVPPSAVTMEGALAYVCNELDAAPFDVLCHSIDADVLTQAMAARKASTEVCQELSFCSDVDADEVGAVSITAGVRAKVKQVAAQVREEKNAAAAEDVLTRGEDALPATD